MALKKDGMWGIMSGTEEAPTGDVDRNKLERYAGRRDKALATVVLSVGSVFVVLNWGSSSPGCCLEETGRTVPEKVVGQVIVLET